MYHWKRKICSPYELIVLLILFLNGSFIISIPSYGDLIKTKNKTYSNIYLIEGEYLIYILNPEDGTIENLSYEDVVPDSCQYDPVEKREELKKVWLAKKNTFANANIKKQEENKIEDKNKEWKKVQNIINSKDSHHDATGKLLRVKRNSVYDDSYESLTSNNVTNLSGTKSTFSLSPNIKSSNVAQQLPGSPYTSGTRDTFPKIVVRNPFGGTANYLGNQYNIAQRYPGRYIPPNLYGGYPPQLPQGYVGSGGYGGMFRDVTSLSNISDLFSTIDDQAVGEFGYRIIKVYRDQENTYSNKHQLPQRKTQN